MLSNLVDILQFAIFVFFLWTNPVKIHLLFQKERLLSKLYEIEGYTPCCLLDFDCFCIDCGSAFREVLKPGENGAYWEDKLWEVRTASCIDMIVLFFIMIHHDNKLKLHLGEVTRYIDDY